MIVIDTHILIWWLSGHKSLTQSAADLLEQTMDNGSEVIVSAISAWEIAMLIDKGRLVLSMDVESWLSEAAQVEGIRFIPVDVEIGLKATMLPGEFHKDPADRMIVATARKFAAPLITADEKIINYPHVQTVS